MTNLILLISGGEPKQVSMKTKKLKAKKMFGDMRENKCEIYSIFL